MKGPDGQEQTLPADVVILGVGVAPATEYLKNSKGFENLVDKSGAITVDEFLKVKGLDGSVYAIGESTRSSHHLNIIQMGKQATLPCILNQVQVN